MIVSSDQCNCRNHQHQHQHHHHRRKSVSLQPKLWLLLICFGCLLVVQICSASKLGVHMDRSPESTIAPLFDEVLFECQLNLKPDELKWRFRPLNSRADYKYINKNVSFIKLMKMHAIANCFYAQGGYNITTEGDTTKLRIYVTRAMVGEYQCVAWYGSSALASIPAKLMLATIQLDTNSKFRYFKNYTLMEISFCMDLIVLISSRAESDSQRSPNMGRESTQWKVQTGNSVLVKCGDVISMPPPVWSFYRNNIQIFSNALPPPPNSGTLVLQSVDRSHSGNYTCAAINSITGAEVRLPQKHQISVVTESARSAPAFLQQPSARYSTKQGDTVVLECPGTGNPTPRATWSRPNLDAGSLQNNRTTQLAYGLRLVNVVPEDRGTYICRLDNGVAPPLVLTVRLEVPEGPVILQGPNDTLTDETATLELECRATGSPTPDIYWMINGQNTSRDALTQRNGSRLYMRSVEKKHAGIVQCFARNEFGEVCGAHSYIYFLTLNRYFCLISTESFSILFSHHYSFFFQNDHRPLKEQCCR